MSEVEFSVRQNEFTIRLIVSRENQDLLVQLIGGDVPHFGVVTAFNSDTKLQDINLPSRPRHVHQEAFLTHELAQVILPVVEGNVFVVSGVHVNEISQEQMQAVPVMIQKLGSFLKQWIIDNPTKKIEEKFSE